MSMHKETGYPRVGIVILNWKRPDDLMACLKSLEGLDYPSFEVVVVDNASNNGSVAAIRQAFPRVILLENGRNLGFAGGCNVGINHLVQSGADYVFLLNDDTEVAPDLLRVLVGVGERNPQIGILGPKICYFDRPDVVWSAGGSIDKYGEPRHLDVDLRDGEGPQEPREVDYVTGCGILVKRCVIEEVGPLDDRFFAYFEETEWCARARRAGFRVVYVPSARMWHKIESADRSYSRPYLYLMTRNRLLYLRCSGASPLRIFQASVDLLRTAASWSVRSEHRDMRPFSGVLLRGIFDFTIGRFGAPPARL